MPVFRLSEELIFPPPWLAEDGLLAVGGDLSIDRLLLAYRNGIFPWYSEGEPVLWWSPEPRAVLAPREVHVSRRLARTIRKGAFHFSCDTAFDEVIRACAAVPRRHEKGTWITTEMIAAYIRLHKAGYAHSFETWQEDKLAGGLYGVSLGACFYGESMFSLVPDASKAALATGARQFERWGISLIDCQVANDHMLSMGTHEIPRKRFLRLLAECHRHPTRHGPWALDPDLAAPGNATTPPAAS